MYCTIFNLAEIIINGSIFPIFLYSMQHTSHVDIMLSFKVGSIVLTSPSERVTPLGRLSLLHCQPYSTSLPPSAVDPAVITGQPVSLTLVVPGQSSTFIVTATGDNLMYQWQKDGSDIASGVTSATYTIAAVTESDEGAYRCVVTNAANSDTSTAASLTVCKCVPVLGTVYQS